MRTICRRCMYVLNGNAHHTCACTAAKTTHAPNKRRGCTCASHTWEHVICRGAHDTGTHAISMHVIIIHANDDAKEHTVITCAAIAHTNTMHETSACVRIIMP